MSLSSASPTPLSRDRNASKSGVEQGIGWFRFPNNGCPRTVPEGIRYKDIWICNIQLMSIDEHGVSTPGFSSGTMVVLQIEL